MLKLTPRLQMAAALCRGGSAIADIGCDHGYLSAYLVQNGAARAIACDVRPGPLARAGHTARLYGLADKIDLRLCDGLSAVSPAECDTIAICGMGGELIASILAAAAWTADGRHRLILQPQSKAAQLRRFLAENGYTIQAEALAREGHRIYCAIAACGGGPALGAENHYLFTKKMTADPLFQAYLRDRLQKLGRRLGGLKAGGRDYSPTAQIIEMLEKHINAT